MKAPFDLRQLRYFVCLAEELHFGRAAERLGMAQAPLSMQIRQMEQQLGVVLFHRTTRRTRLTSAGETLLRHARTLLDGADRAAAHTRAMSDQAGGRLRVAGVSVALSHVLPPILREFRRIRPAVIVQVSPLNTSGQLKVLEAGDIDVAFIRPTERAAFMQTEYLMSEGFVAALPKGHPLAKKSALEVTDFEGESLIGYAPVLGANYAVIMTNTLRRAGLHYRIIHEGTHSAAIATHVASGLGVAIMPSWIAYQKSPYLEYRPILDLPNCIDLVVAWPMGEISPVTLDFVAITKRLAPKIADEIGFSRTNHV
ncbi:LysR substrate-binding domain-containing protein [Falsirhodobacter sp. alg1]|uniref:LysR substrate-binding domain-containing protein n=1 Tax=Falsirhodobacter sp. alg1 TaxID=1472418 RepID=UPI0005EF388F|nr:LysR substrate-binding domain-containing protein [Falsirhodobacter sp. alg1]